MPSAFISYVRDNSEQVDKLAAELRRHGVTVWLDRDDILPGADWQYAIRQAIEGGDYFIACFSAEYVARRKTYMHTEIGLAIEMLQQMPIGRIWFIPVLFSDCQVPDLPIGGGRTLTRLNWEPLHKDWDRGVRRILKAMRVESAGKQPAPIGPTQLSAADQRIEVLPGGTMHFEPAKDATANGVSKRLRTELDELQRRYDNLTSRIRAVDTDLGREPDSERRQMLEERRADLAASREKTAGRMAQIEEQLVQIAEQKSPPPQVTTAKVKPVQPEVKQPAPTGRTLVQAPKKAVPLPPLAGDLVVIDKPIRLELIRIPAGEFLMGKEKRAVDVAEFYIGKYPITNAQYAAFVQSKNYDRPSHWKEGRIPAGNESHPVVYVSWRDSVAFCDWLSEATGRKFRLPSEAEWEKVARGGLRIPGPDGAQMDNPLPDRQYPWGNKFDKNKCNVLESGIRDTTPVGNYSPAGGESPYGVADMAGNVGEWCSSLYRDYPYNATDGREDLAASGDRVLRGGSWYGSVNFAAAPVRSYLHPGTRVHFSGFRVCAVLPPP